METTLTAAECAGGVKIITKGKIDDFRLVFPPAVTSVVPPVPPPAGEGLPDRLNLEFANMAIFESGGKATGATSLSPTEYQIVGALDFASRFDLGLTIKELADFVDRWRPDPKDKFQDIRVDDGTVKSNFSRINARLQDGKIPFEIISEMIEFKEKEIISREKQYFLRHISP